jgi:hypothetical protein
MVTLVRIQAMIQQRIKQHVEGKSALNIQAYICGSVKTFPELFDVDGWCTTTSYRLNSVLLVTSACRFA